jgi:hypothetical protein
LCEYRKLHGGIMVSVNCMSTANSSLRYSNDPHEEPQRYDLRVGISAQQLYPDIPQSKVVRTAALTVKGQLLPVWSSLMRELLVYKLDSINCLLRKFDPSDLRQEV